MHARVKIASCDLPYGEVSPVVELAGGPISSLMYDTMVAHSVSSCPKEWAGIVWWDTPAARYQLWEPPLTGSEFEVGYARYVRPPVDEQLIVLDVHSHGRLGAFFSNVDDSDDRAQPTPALLSAVLGRCSSTDAVTTVCRLIVNGRFFDVPWRPWDKS